MQPTTQVDRATYATLLVDGHRRPLRDRCGLPDCHRDSRITSPTRVNDSWGRTSVIMTDKDVTERSVLADVFSDATLQLCLFHTLRSFKRVFNGEDETARRHVGHSARDSGRYGARQVFLLYKKGHFTSGELTNNCLGMKHDRLILTEQHSIQSTTF